MTILGEVVDHIEPSQKGGITFYPARQLGRIFDWAATRGRTIEWIEGVFFRPETDEGQLSLGYIQERKGDDPAQFRQTCLLLAGKMELEADALGLGAYFEIGISD